MPSPCQKKACARDRPLILASGGCQRRPALPPASDGTLVRLLPVVASGLLDACFVYYYPTSPLSHSRDGATRICLQVSGCP